jgi:energy-coupling factor transporter ATP-binding protein EcfA2
MNLEQAIAAIDNLMLSRRGKRMIVAERAVLQSAWNKQSYEDIAQETGFSHNYLQTTVGRKLWNFLSKELSGGERIDKSSFRDYMEQHFNADPYGEDQVVRPGLQVFGQTPKISEFYGRDLELMLLKKSISENRCVVLLGAMGVGKSTLAAKMIEQLLEEKSKEFQYIAWKTILYPITLDDLVTDLIELLDNISLKKITRAANIQDKVNVLLDFMKSNRCLIVFDKAKVLFDRSHTNKLNLALNDIKVFLGRMIVEQHKSCLLLTSQFLSQEFSYLESTGLSVSVIKLGGLDIDSAMKVLISKGLAEDDKLKYLIHSYRGNPRILIQVSKRITSLFGSNIDQVIANKTSLGFSFVHDFFNGLFLDLLKSEPYGICVLNVLMDKILSGINEFRFLEILTYFNEYKKNGETPMNSSSLAKIIEILEEYALIERIETEKYEEACFTLQPLIRKYIQIDPGGYISDGLKICFDA